MNVVRDTRRSGRMYPHSGVMVPARVYSHEHGPTTRRTLGSPGQAGVGASGSLEPMSLNTSSGRCFSLPGAGPHRVRARKAVARD